MTTRRAAHIASINRRIARLKDEVKELEREKAELLRRKEGGHHANRT